MSTERCSATSWTVGPGGTVQHVVLVTGLKHYLGPFEAYAQTPVTTPFREEMPRVPDENFYYGHGDLLFEAAVRSRFTWSVHRAHTTIGWALGNAMNMGVTLAVYATMCREAGKPFVFPGSPQQYAGVTDVTDVTDASFWPNSSSGRRRLPTPPTRRSTSSTVTCSVGASCGR